MDWAPVSLTKVSLFSVSVTTRLTLHVVNIPKTTNHLISLPHTVRTMATSHRRMESPIISAAIREGFEETTSTSVVGEISEVVVVNG